MLQGDLYLYLAIKNLEAKATCHPGFVHPCIKVGSDYNAQFRKSPYQQTMAINQVYKTPIK
jgi:hypothetical protein